jgi:ribonuclease P protein component
MNAMSPSTGRVRFPRTARVRARAEYGRVFDQGRRAQHPLLALHYASDDQPARLGLAVSRKVDTRAVVRNRIKRVLRDRFRHLRAQLAPGAYVVVARSAAAGADNAALRAAFEQLLHRVRALLPVTPAGTMPASDAPPQAPSSLPS